MTFYTSSSYSEKCANSIKQLLVLILLSDDDVVENSPTCPPPFPPPRSGSLRFSFIDRYERISMKIFLKNVAKPNYLVAELLMIARNNMLVSLTFTGSSNC